MTECWLCHTTEVESGRPLLGDGAHAECPRPEPRPSRYVPLPPAVERRLFRYDLPHKLPRTMRRRGGRPRLYSEEAAL